MKMQILILVLSSAFVLMLACCRSAPVSTVQAPETAGAAVAAADETCACGKPAGEQCADCTEHAGHQAAAAPAVQQPEPAAPEPLVRSAQILYCTA